MGEKPFLRRNPKEARHAGWDVGAPQQEPEAVVCWVSNTAWSSREEARLGCWGQRPGFKQVPECSFRLSGGGCMHRKVTGFVCLLAHLALEEEP